MKENINLLVYRYYAYTATPLLFMPVKGLANNSAEIVSILQKLDEWYGNTDQETTDWALEYQLWVRMLFDGYVMLNPQHLDLETILPIFLKMLRNLSSGAYQSFLYQAAFRYVKDNKLSINKLSIDPEAEYIEIQVPVDTNLGKCPFCSEESQLSIVTTDKILFATCWNCGAKGPVVKYDGESPTGKDILNAGALWNEPFHHN